MGTRTILRNGGGTKNSMEMRLTRIKEVRKIRALSRQYAQGGTMDYLETVIDLISKNLEVPKEKLNAQTDIVNDLDADSLDLVEMVMNIEDEFDIQIDDDVLVNLHTIGDVARELEELDTNR